MIFLLLNFVVLMLIWVNVMIFHVDRSLVTYNSPKRLGVVIFVELEVSRPGPKLIHLLMNRRLRPPRPSRNYSSLA